MGSRNSPKKKSNDQETHEEILDIASHQGDANQNSNEISSHTIETVTHGKEQEILVLVRLWGKGSLLHYWWEWLLVQSFWKTIWTFLRRLEIQLPLDTAIPLLGIYCGGQKICSRNTICISIFIAALFTVARIWKQPECPKKGDLIRKLVYSHNGINAAIRRDEVMKFTYKSVYIENMLSEISEAERNRYTMRYLLQRQDGGVAGGLGA